MYIVSKNHNVKDVYVHCGLWLWIEVDIASWYRVAIIERVKLIIECHKVWQLHFLFRMGRVSFLEKLINYSSQINLALKTMTIKLSQLDCRWKDQGSGPVWLIVLCSCTRHSSLTMPLSTRSINVYFFLSSRASGILQILQSDWFQEQAVFSPSSPLTVGSSFCNHLLGLRKKKNVIHQPRLVGIGKNCALCLV